MKLVKEFCLKEKCTEDRKHILNLVNEKYGPKDYQDYLILTKTKLSSSIISVSIEASIKSYNLETEI